MALKRFYGKILVYVFLLTTLSSCALVKKKQLEHTQNKQENKIFTKEKETYIPAIENSFEIPLLPTHLEQGQGATFKLGLDNTQIKAQIKDKILKLSIKKEEEKISSTHVENTHLLAKENTFEKEKITYRIPTWVWILILFNLVYLVWKLREFVFKLIQRLS